MTPVEEKDAALGARGEYIYHYILGSDVLEGHLTKLAAMMHVRATGD